MVLGGPGTLIEIRVFRLQMMSGCIKMSVLGVIRFFPKGIMGYPPRPELPVTS